MPESSSRAWESSPMADLSAAQSYARTGVAVENDSCPWRIGRPDACSRIDAWSGKPLVGAADAGKRWTSSRWTVTGPMGAPLLADPEYDIVPNRPGPEVDGASRWRATIFLPEKRGRCWASAITPMPRESNGSTRTLSRIRRRCARVPDTVNLFVNSSLDGRRMLWLAFSDQDPGTYLLLDLERAQVDPTGQRAMSWINRRRIAPMLSIKYRRATASSSMGS